ncbi:MAG: hypothetical protein AB1Z21_11815 [Synechococcaceae cyanobacterium]
MDLLSLTHRRGVLWIDGVLLLLFGASAASGLLDSLSQSFMAVMEEAPLSRAYVLAVALLGALLPLAARLIRPRIRAVPAVLDPFLLLLAGQLACEVTVVLLSTKGLAVLVGLVFSLLRLAQVRLLWPISVSIGWLQGLLMLQGVVWGANALQIGVNRIRPLLN